MATVTLNPSTSAAPGTASGAALLCQALRAHGVSLLFGYPGGAALPLYRELARWPELRHVLIRHEQNAALAADGYARATGRPGVCLATSGPGATNLITGIATAMMDSVPLLALTGQVATPAIGTQAFQEVDIVGMVGPVTKAAFQARSAAEVPGLVAEAFRVMLEGRPGPVLLDLPKDVLMQVAELPRDQPVAPDHPAMAQYTVTPNHSVTLSAAKSQVAHCTASGDGPTVSEPAQDDLMLRVAQHDSGVRAPQHSDALLRDGAGNGVSEAGGRQPTHADERAIDHLASLLQRAERPVLLVGRGVLLAGAWGPLRELAERAELPVLTTLLGLGALPESHPLAFGMAGMHGTVAANLGLHFADLVVGLGARFDDRVVGRAADFAPGAMVAHVDVDPTAFGRVARCDLAVLGDVGEVLDGLLERLTPRRHEPWLTALRGWQAEHAACLEPRGGAQLESPAVLRALRDVTGGRASLVADVGQHQMYAALHTGVDRPNSFFTSGGLGTMGYAVQAAMGVKLARPDEEVWVVVGDGGFQMSTPELTTLAANGIELKIAVLNNGCLGMVRQWQELFYDGVYSHSILPQPDFARLAEAHGCAGRVVERPDEVVEALRWARETPGPVVLDFRLPLEETVLPMVPAGAANGELLCAEGRALPG